MKNIFLISFGILISQVSTAQDASDIRYMNQPWKMHHIDRQFWNHNSLSPGDINKDGLDDYLVIHEGADKVTILFNPGAGDPLYHEWGKVVISDGKNIEYGYFGDLNGDGNLDAVYANGDNADVNIIWGPTNQKLKIRQNGWMPTQFRPQRTKVIEAEGDPPVPGG